MRNLALRCFAMACAVCLAASKTRAAYVMTVQEVGPDVVVSGSGTLNMNALTLLNTAPTPPFQIFPADGFALAGFSNAAIYSGISGAATNFGSGGPTSATLTAGDIVGVRASGVQALIVPDGYVSNTALTSSATFANTSLSNLGLTSGTYVFAWGAGADSDSLTITSAVPEPSAGVLLGFGALGAIFAARRRRAA